MKRELAVLAFCFLALSTAYANEEALKGSDYITKDVGATYTYVYNRLDKPAKLTAAFDLTVKSCNESKTKCVYETVTKMGSDKPYLANESVYKIKDGVVYFSSIKSGKPDGTIENIDSKPQELFPKEIILNKTEIINYSDEMSDSQGTSVFTKVIPEIVINKNTYKDCIRMDNNVTNCYKNKEDNSKNCHHTIDYEIYCKGVGLVTENIDGDTLLLEKITKK
ncbi:hypothetical protein [Francisella salimarina]|uniref:hypothetical protein n=1 Tax=Francisella salimarina TaxID=2599927 RepID=UPI003751236F